MNRYISFTVYDKTLRFFAINATDIDDPISHANITLIGEERYSFGIVLNEQTNHFLLEDIEVQLFSTKTCLNYYVLDINHKPYMSGSYTNKNLRFIFIDIQSMLDRNDEKLLLDFYQWLINSIEEYSGNNLFFVTDITLFNFKLMGVHSELINNLIQIIKTYIKFDVTYISTDNDHFNVIKICETSINNINVILCGKLSRSHTAPQVFKHKRQIRPENINANKYHSKLSGYVSIDFHGGITSLNYNDLTKSDISIYVINKMIGMIYVIEANSCNTILYKDILVRYKEFALENNLFNIYQDSWTEKKNKRKKVLTKNLLNKIIPTVDRILTGHW